MLCGEPDALAGGPPVMAMLMQNANSANVAPDSAAVARGLGREDLFTCVHEQFMTATAKYADILLPAAMFLEYDDIYYGLGHTHLTVGPAVLDRYEDCRTNHELICALAQRLGSNQPSFRMSAVELLDATLRASGRGTWDEAAARGWIDCAEGFEASHFLDGFPSSDGRFHFKPDWAAVGPYHAGLKRAARPSRELRAGERGAAVPPGRAAGARLPQHDLHRDAGLDRSARASRAR